jgi:hypothetical protein
MVSFQRAFLPDSNQITDGIEGLLTTYKWFVKVSSMSCHDATIPESPSSTSKNPMDDAEFSRRCENERLKIQTAESDGMENEMHGRGQLHGRASA